MSSVKTHEHEQIRSMWVRVVTLHCVGGGHYLTHSWNFQSSQQMACTYFPPLQRTQCLHTLNLHTTYHTHHTQSFPTIFTTVDIQSSAHMSNRIYAFQRDVGGVDRGRGREGGDWVELPQPAVVAGRQQVSARQLGFQTDWALVGGGLTCECKPGGTHVCRSYRRSENFRS